MRSTQVSVSEKKITPIPIFLKQLLAQDWILATGLFVLSLALRLPFRSQILYHWDSVNFAYALREFNIAKEQPHPPGYLVYVWLSRLVDTFIDDAQTTLVTISVIASALAVVSLFYLGRSMFDRYTGLIAALFMATSPLFWFYGEIALPHTLDTLLVIVCVWWLYKTMKSDRRYLYPAVVLLSVAGGIRPQTLVFLLPLLLFALRHIGWKHFFIAGLLGAVICLAWFIPLIILSGGPANYFITMGEFSKRFQDTTSVFLGAGWWGLRRNIIKLTLYTLYAWSIALIPTIIYSVYRLYHREWPQNWERLIFLLLWILPSLIFYVLIHMGQQGLVFVYLPSLLLLSAFSLIQLLSSRHGWLVTTTTLIIMFNISVFYLLPEYPLGPGTQRLLTRATLANSDQYYMDRFDAIGKNFAPKSTAILANNWHHVEYYLPSYPKLEFGIGNKWEQNEGELINGAGEVPALTPAMLGLQPNTNNQVTIVIFDSNLIDYNHTPEQANVLFLPDGKQLTYLTLRPNDQLVLESNSFGLLAE